MDINLAHFNTEIGRKKPENILHTDAPCPFCARDTLTNIIAANGDIILLKNKYPVIEDADQLVLIEGKSCEIDIPVYSRSHMHRLIAFGMHHWTRMRETGFYDGVLFFKNYGPYAGGTMRHPHMQLVGFPHFRPELAFSRNEFEGLTIAEQDGVVLNLSTRPRVGFWELNIIPRDPGATDTIADYIQIAVDFLRRRMDSYNIFFYNDGSDIFIKIMPRFATSPIFIGYNIRLLPSNLQEMRDRIRTTYFEQRSTR